ncbi:hypothetical protein D0Q02_25685 [Micromonospora craniellae]|uniref:Uncharacterized protein n=1 Tax=Micromonospora craniellae TaxID=2294034 RepID=A0A372FSP6_9ACTN|nr:hypothetical protein ID554_25225 [Micromonospora craniellae]RFS43822.1 hypothetical protein D0Q02_25685 [Micromonospora craniellae]
MPCSDPADPAAAIFDGISRWVGSPPIRELVAGFGGRWPAGDLGAVLAALDGFSARHWDFRAGRERPEAREPDLDERSAAQVHAAASTLGLVRPRPPARTRYAHLVVLGGLAHACLRRVAYAAHLLRGDVGVTGEVAVLGSYRPLSEVERRTLADAGVTGCDTEVDVLDAAVRRTFGRSVPDSEDGLDAGHPHHSWSSRTYRPTGLPQVRVLAAPSSEPQRRRAHTADTQRFWAEHARLLPDEPVLLVTAPIYVPFQHCDALRTLAVPYGCEIDTVGVDPTLPDLTRLPEPTLTPGRYLQEIRSAIRSMRALHTTLAEVGQHARRTG